MRNVLAGCAAALVACAATTAHRHETPPPGAVAAASAVPTPPPPERLTADTPRTTVEGATFIAPAEWTISVRGPATILEAPEGDSRIALVDVRAAGAKARTESPPLDAGGKARTESPPLDAGGSADRLPR